MEIQRRWIEYETYCDPSDVNRIISDFDTGFNLANDLKQFDIEDTRELSANISAELAKGVVRPNSCEPIIGSILGICVVKARLAFEGGGKRKGLRAYVVVIPSKKISLLVGLTRHCRGVDNISADQKKKLKKLISCLTAELKH